MELRASVTDDNEVVVEVFQGPLMSSLIFSLEDEAGVLKVIGDAFRDARALKEGYTREEIEEMNRERASAPQN